MAFLTQYNVVGIAVGLIIAAKVGTLVTSLIEDLITPAILSPVFSRMGVTKLEELSARGILYGKVIARVIDFLVTAFIVFYIAKQFSLPTK